MPLGPKQSPKAAQKAEARESELRNAARRARLALLRAVREAVEQGLTFDAVRLAEAYRHVSDGGPA